MLIRFTMLVPLALTFLLSACAGHLPPAEPLPAKVAEQPAAPEQDATAEALAELTDDQPYELPQLTDEMLAYGLTLVGTRYRPGGTSVQSGFDCSGFVSFLYKEELGIELPRSTREMITLDAPKVARSELEPGDIIFFNNRGRGRVSHAGIYLGDNQFIHSSSSRSGGVRVDSLGDRYWNSSYMLAKRVLDEHQLPAASTGPQQR